MSRQDTVLTSSKGEDIWVGRFGYFAVLHPDNVETGFLTNESANDRPVEVLVGEETH